MSAEPDGYVVPRYLDREALLMPGDIVVRRYGPERDPLAVLRDAIDKLVRGRVTVFVPAGTPDDIVAAVRTLPTVRLVEASPLVPSGEAWVFDPLRDVADATGVSHVTIRRVELGRRNLRGRVAAIDADTVVRVLRWLAT